MIFVHGAASDASTWFYRTDPNLDVIGTQYAMEGFDVWYANLRGSIPSRSHELASFDPDGDFEFQRAAYWDFDYNDMAEQDIQAVIEKVIQVNGDCKKATLIGHSLGATVIPNALSKSSRARKYVQASINMGPCFIPDGNSFAPGLEISNARLDLIEGAFDFFNIESLFGPNWDTDLGTICTLGLSFGFGDVCTTLTDIELYSATSPFGAKEIGTKLVKHLIQNINNQDYHRIDASTTPSAVLSDIKGVPVRFMFATGDMVCPQADQQRFVDAAVATTKRRPTFTFEGRDHFFFAGANDAEFKSELDRMLRKEDKDITERACRRPFKW